MNIARPQVSTMTQVPHVYYNQALELARSGSLAEARDKLAAVLTLEPESVDAHVVHGKVHAQMEQYDWAIGCWTRALELDPENAAAQAGIARARQLLQRQRTARRLWLAARVTCVAAVFLLGAWVVRPYQAAMARRAIVPPEPIQAALRRSPSLRSAIEIGIGVNTGDMVVGNMGSVERMDYTVIGDNVNLGARLESLNKEFATHIIISESTYQYVKDFVKTKPLGTTKVKGKEKPVEIFEVIEKRQLKIQN